MLSESTVESFKYLILVSLTNISHSNFNFSPSKNRKLRRKTNLLSCLVIIVLNKLSLKMVIYNLALGKTLLGILSKI